MKEKIRRIKIIFAAIMIFTGAAVFSYPFLSSFLASRHASVAVQQYSEAVQEMEKEKIDAMKEAARAYNEQLQTIAQKNARGEGEIRSGYVDLAGVGEALGYISIPKIDLKLPVYEGVSDSVLAQGIGHIPETSYPLGGESTHSALSGHRGLAEAELFTNLDKVTRGDMFYLHILDEVLAYKVDRIDVVEPDEGEILAVVEGEDLCSLVTCTPLGINSHRLIVRGMRAEYTGEEETAPDTGMLYQSVHTGTAVRRLVEIWPWLTLAAMLAIGAEAMLMLAILRQIRRRREDD